MRILDKYILKELLGPFVFGVCSFSSIFIGTSTLMRIAKLITQYGAEPLSVAKLFFYSLPSIVVLTFPMSMLLATLLAFGRLSASSEITAMKSGGLSLMRLAAPVFMAAFFVSCFSIVFNEKVVPAANSAYRYVVKVEIEKNTKPKTQDHVIIKDIEGDQLTRLTYARRFDEASSAMQAVTVQDFEGDRVVRIQNAEKAVWQDGRWEMEHGVINDLTAEGGLSRTLTFDKQVLPLDKNPKAISMEQKEPEEMTIRELKLHINALKREYAKVGKFEMELYQRYTIPFAAFVFSMIGTPLGLSPQRSSSSIGLGISIIVIFIYYATMTICTALGQGGTVPAILAAWIPNLLGVAAGLWLIWRKSR